MTDVRVHDVATGRDCWYASHSLTPIDDLGPLPSRREAQARASIERLAALREIHNRHVADWHKPWPGAEHGKAIIGCAIVGAIEATERDVAAHAMRDTCDADYFD